MEQMPKKISQIKLSDFTYDIDVANNLKATKLIGEQLTKVAPVKAILKPDGQYDFFDENNKISSHYISDTILGQLKFGGTIAYDGADIFSINPSTLFYERALEFEATKESPSGESFSNPILVASYGELGITLAILGDWGNGSSPLFNNDLVNLEGFYFILTTPSDPYTGNSPEEILIPKSNIGDWWVICGGKIEKIDNTDTITHIDETDGTSLLEITGSSGLKLNKLTGTEDGIAFSGKLSSEILDGNSVELSPNNIALDYQSPAGRESKMTLTTNGLITSSTVVYPQGGESIVSPYGISTELNGIKATLRPAYTNSTSYLPIPQVSIEDTSYSYASLAFDGTSGVLELNDTSDNTSIITANSLQSPEISATQKMTAPTITNKTDKSQVVNLEYFENNATKVDWENIDSDVQIINGHNFKIQGKYTEQNIGCGILPSSFDSVEPQRDSSTGQWGWGADEYWTSPYWGYFEIKKNCYYIVKPAKTSGPFNNTECLDSGASVLVSAELSTAPLLELTSEGHDLIYQPGVFDEVSGEYSFGGYIEFKSPIDGFAFFGTSDSFDPVLWVVIERVLEKEVSAEIEGDLKVTGDIEVTGDLSFGADSHLVFGTIEGTDFIVDYAKVKNAPVEDDDVINKAYFDANKGSGGGSSDISDYQGNAKINGNLEVTGNLSFDGDLEMSSIEAQSIKINGKRVLTEDDLANLVAYPAAEDYTF